MPTEAKSLLARSYRTQLEVLRPPPRRPRPLLGEPATARQPPRRAFALKHAKRASEPIPPRWLRPLGSSRRHSPCGSSHQYARAEDRTLRGNQASPTDGSCAPRRCSVAVELGRRSRHRVRLPELRSCEPNIIYVGDMATPCERPKSRGRRVRSY